jgi:hypothetical protein
MIQLDPGPPPCGGHGSPQPPLEDRVRDALYSVDNGLEDARESWELVRRLYNYLVQAENKGRCNQRMYDILEMIAPVMDKYGRVTPYHVEHREKVRDGY